MRNQALPHHKTDFKTVLEDKQIMLSSWWGHQIRTHFYVSFGRAVTNHVFYHFIYRTFWFPYQTLLNCTAFNSNTKSNQTDVDSSSPKPHDGFNSICKSSVPGASKIENSISIHIPKLNSKAKWLNCIVTMIHLYCIFIYYIYIYKLISETKGSMDIYRCNGCKIIFTIVGESEIRAWLVRKMMFCAWIGKKNRTWKP